MSVTPTQAEEVAIFAARRAVATGSIGRTLVDTLHQLCQSDRASIRNHAVSLACRAAQIEGDRRNGSAA